MWELSIENVRCFQEAQSAPIRPITLLVGENSSGKTTFLALARMVWELVQGNIESDLFNEEPFLLGSYTQVASYRGEQAGSAPSFVVGMALPLSPQGRLTVNVRFVSLNAQPKLEEWVLQVADSRIEVQVGERNEVSSAVIIIPNGSQEIELYQRRFHPQYVLRDILSALNSPSKKESISESRLDVLKTAVHQLSHVLASRPIAFAPIRTRPQRTYDPIRDVPKPEGSHVPMLLSRLSLSDPARWAQLHESLMIFGRASGLFDDIEVQKKGHLPSDPFQIGITTKHASFNLVDVGYGVSQVLPIIVDILQAPSSSTFLLQQPEVHLHPRAQAELGTFLATLVKTQDKRFIIETHSDYLLDRLRMEVRDQKSISPDEIVILYFEQSQHGVNIHPLYLDDFGNLINAPRSYRQFFLEEERRFLGV